MKKIGILTFHEGINHGGFFQAYAMEKLIEAFNENTRIINYKNRKHWFNEYRAFLRKKRPRQLVGNIIKIARFRKDQRRLKTTPRILTTRHKSIAKLSTSFDIIVVGSDIVWNYEWEFLGRDLIYFGVNLKPAKLVAFAPSFGSLSFPVEISNTILNGLKRFDDIAVRDSNSQRIIKSVINRDVKIVLDPTLLYDFNESLSFKRECFEPYILVYAFLLSSTDIDSIKKFAKSMGIKTIAISYAQVWCDEDFTSVGPIRWISFFKYARFVVTSTFHGTVFSIKMKRQFFTYMNEQIRSKTSSLLDVLSLEKCSSDKGNLMDRRFHPIDYHVVDRILKPMIETDKKILEGMIS